MMVVLSGGEGGGEGEVVRRSRKGVVMVWERVTGIDPNIR